MIKTSFFGGMLAVLLLSSNATVAAIASRHLHPVLLSAAATIVTTLVMLPYARPFLARLRTCLGDRHFLAACALKVINDLSFFIAIGLSGSIEATVIVYLYPVFNLVLAGYVLDDSYERMNVRAWMLVAVAMTAVIVITPLSDFSEISWTIAFLATLSALASVYVVLLQAFADKTHQSGITERSAVFGLFAVSAVVHVLVVAVSWVSLPMPDDITLEGGVVVVLGVLWIGVVVNYVSEFLWLSSSRAYKDISLKSLFFLSPALGSIYFSLAGLDNFDPAVAFSLTGVVVANILLHNRRVDDSSFIILIFGFISFSVLRSIFGETADGYLFRAPEPVYDMYVTGVSVLIGFILLRAFDIYSAGVKAVVRLIEHVIEAARHDVATLERLEDLFEELLAAPDVAYWRQSAGQEAFKTYLRMDGVRQAYTEFFEKRFVAVSYPEYFLTFLICFSIIPFSLAESFRGDGSGFMAVFVASLFFFLPFFIVELTTMRLLRPYVGILVRRIGWLAIENADAHPFLEPRFRFRRARTVRTITMIAILTVVALVSWQLLVAA